MKSRTIKFILLLLFGAFAVSGTAYAETARAGYINETELKLSAECAILIEANTRRVLFASNSLSKRAMASTTKIMTALVVIENCALDDIVVIPKEAEGVEGSSIYLMAGERLTVRELLYGLMLRSGNDAATALALYCSGNIQNFALLMNETAEKIGTTNTHFTNPSGLPDAGHYTTAYDLAIISAKAMEYDVFREIVSTTKTTISWGGHDTDRILVNKNKLLYQYDGADGIKTGYTISAGRCLVSSATRNGMTLIAVVLNCSPMYAECSAMLDFGFDNYKMTKIAEDKTVMGAVNIKNGFIETSAYMTNREYSYPLTVADNVSVTVKIESEDFEAPISEGETIGYMDIYVNNEVVYSLELVSCEGTTRNTFFSRFMTLVRHNCK